MGREAKSHHLALFASIASSVFVYGTHASLLSIRLSVLGCFPYSGRNESITFSYVFIDLESQSESQQKN
jgi:hypothetical protein